MQCDHEHGVAHHRREDDLRLRGAPEEQRADHVDGQHRVDEDHSLRLHLQNVLYESEYRVHDSSPDPILK